MMRKQREMDMIITPEYVMKQLEGFLWSAADKEKVLEILGDALDAAWEDGFDHGALAAERFEP